MRAWKQTLQIISFLLLSSLAVPVLALAAQSKSTDYQVNEVFFGSGGELNACSTDYCSKQSAGETTVGNTASPNYQAQGGFNTDRTPYIEFDVGSENINLGTLNASTTQTATATFTVKAYLAHGYTVINASDPPSNSNYTMRALSTPTASSAGTEQFGINLVANTLPKHFGANPVDTPDNTFSYGQVASDYSQANVYKYAKGDVIASSSSSTSTTSYTISYIFNISNVTPGGVYAMQHVLVATATY
jgi:hypothetical protein